MADGKLIIEVYEYSEGSSSIPSFEFIPCKLSTCLNWNKHATLKEIIQKGFDAQPKKLQNTEKRADVLRMLDEANIGRINVAYKPPRPGVDSCIELTNIIQVSMADADATRGKMPPEASSSSAPSAMNPAGLTTSSGAVPAVRATPARAAST